jgi:hypothetical protein
MATRGRRVVALRGDALHREVAGEENGGEWVGGPRRTSGAGR